ncbi:MAG: hypothetical protein U9P42_05470 [Candidatus Fermentibacteria bacterium]|nr:hypothetical protein [Candidatus Fermentibacteria bacterium]
MNKTTILAVLAAAFLVLTTGCMEKTPLSVTNGLETCNITFVYISRGSSTLWGSNHLPGTDILEPEKTAEVMVRPGVYDLQVIDENGDTYTLNDIRVGADGFNWTVTMDDMDVDPSPVSIMQYAGQCPIAITSNLSQLEINGIWISPSDRNDWGNNHLQGEVLFSGDTYTIYVQSASYDILIEDTKGNTYTRRARNVTGSEGYSWSVSTAHAD